MNAGSMFQTRRPFVAASLLAFSLSIGIATGAGADMLFDDDASDSDSGGDDFGANSRVKDHLDQQASLAELVLPHSEIAGIAFEIASTTKRK